MELLDPAQRIQKSEVKGTVSRDEMGFKLQEKLPKVLGPIFFTLQTIKFWTRV